jgi:N-acetyl-1-D-myo-inositol-2-amino-2-deoxy-alpha-D-glucopyranoside deacetylase
VTMAAVSAAGDPAVAPGTGEPWQVSKVYATAIPKSMLQAGIDSLRGSDTSLFGPGVESADDLPFGVPDETVTTEIDARDHLEAKVAAMRAHRSQISVDGPFFALADGAGHRAFGIEHYVLLRGTRGPAHGPQGREDDLFAGLT